MTWFLLSQTTNQIFVQIKSIIIYEIKSRVLMYFGYVCGKMQFRISKLELKIQTFLYGPKLNFLNQKFQIIFLPQSSIRLRILQIRLRRLIMQLNAWILKHIYNKITYTGRIFQKFSQSFKLRAAFE